MEQLYKKIDRHIDERWEEEISFLQDIGRYPSLPGNEAPLQMFLAEYFEKDLKLEVDSFVPDINKISGLQGYSPAILPYDGRPVVIGVLKSKGPRIGKSLILQSHIDVVPLGPIEKWNYDPWGSIIDGYRMYGRGIQDMKSGMTAMIFALKAIKELGIELGADVILQSVIEEESTGNGALATLDRGYTADGALIPEPFGPKAIKSQVGVIWFRVKVTGSGAHTERADQAVNAIEKAYVLMDALREYRVHINNQPRHPDFIKQAHPLNVNIGTIKSGDWPSSVPSECTFEVRVGFYPGQKIEDVFAEVKSWLLAAANKDNWLKKVNPEIKMFGMRAEGSTLDEDSDIIKTLQQAHKLSTGKGTLEMESITATTDTRFFNLYYGIPATCYGPVGDGMHGPNEWVNLPSVKSVTKTYAYFLLKWCGVLS